MDVGDDVVSSCSGWAVPPTDTRQRCLETAISVERDKGAAYGSSSERSSVHLVHVSTTFPMVVHSNAITR